MLSGSCNLEEDERIRQAEKASWKIHYLSWVVKNGWDGGSWKCEQRALQIEGRA